MQDDDGKYYGDACGRCCWQVYWPVFWLGLALTPCAVSELCAKLLAPSKSDLQMARILVIARHYEILFGLKPLSCLFYFPKDTKHSILSCIEFQGLFQQFLFEYSILRLIQQSFIQNASIIASACAFHEMKIFIRWFLIKRWPQPSLFYWERRRPNHKPYCKQKLSPKILHMVFIIISSISGFNPTLWEARTEYNVKVLRK